MKIVTQAEQQLEVGLQSIFERVLSKLNQDGGQEIAKSIRSTTQDHIAHRYPGSQHWDPSKVKLSQSLGVIGQVDVDIPGASRAYSDLDIHPRFRKALAIPMHSAAYGHKPAEVPDLLLIKKKNGSAFLAQQLMSGGLRFMYVLKDRVHQRRDESLMPSDETYVQNAGDSISKLAVKAVEEVIRSI